MKIFPASGLTCALLLFHLSGASSPVPDGSKADGVLFGFRDASQELKADTDAEKTFATVSTRSGDNQQKLMQVSAAKGRLLVVATKSGTDLGDTDQKELEGLINDVLKKAEGGSATSSPSSTSSSGSMGTSSPSSSSSSTASSTSSATMSSGSGASSSASPTASR